MKPIRSDEQLIDTFLTGEKEESETAFEMLVKRHGPMVLGVCRHILRRDQDAEDAFQATFLAAARKAGTIHNREILGGLAPRGGLPNRHPSAGTSRPIHTADGDSGGGRVSSRDPSTQRVATRSSCFSARRSMACPRSTACWCCTPTWKARATSRSPGCYGVRSARSRGGCRGRAPCYEHD